MTKAQIGFEFLILMMMVFTIFILFYRGSFDFKADYEEKRIAYAVKDISFKVRDEILLAQNSYDGYSRTFTLPEFLQGGHVYTIDIQNNLLFVESGIHIIDLPVPTLIHNVSADDKTITIRREGGVINFTTSP